jgi:hypothetical protein
VTGSPIDDYLDELFAEVRKSPPGQARALLSEAEAHLREAADEGLAQGLTPEEAEQQAVLRFGAARTVARDDRNRGLAGLARQVVVSGWSLGSVGAIAVGFSGMVAGIMRLAGASNTFMAGGRPLSGLSGYSCKGWMANYPLAHTCGQAALADWANDIVLSRVMLGLLGLASLAVFYVVRRWWKRAPWWSPLPSTVADTIAATLFGAAGAAFVVLGLDAVFVSSSQGAGLWFSAAPVAVAAAVIFGARLVKDLRSVPSIK